MKGLRKKLENIFAAVAFAEDGEFETAREIMKEDITKENLDTTSIQKSTQIPVHATEL